MEDKADNSTMKCSILPEGQAMSTIGYEGGRDVIYQRGYGDHPNTVSMIWCSRARRLYLILGWAQIRVVIDGVASSRIVRKSS